jgi:3,4-dihydroxy 2-butanone 4-phosphate synthase/GTP cyclohydrolase II
VIVEILNDDGSMARRPDLERFAQEHGIRIGTIADLIRYRLEKERSVERIAERDIATEFGPFRLFCYEDHVNSTVHLALVRGNPSAEKAPLVRVHLKDTVRDLVGAVEKGHSWSLRGAMQRIAAEGSGIVVLLRPEESPLEIAEAVRSPDGQSDANPARGAQVLRTYGIGAQILRDLGVSNMRVLSAPKQMHGLSAFGLEVADYVD